MSFYGNEKPKAIHLDKMEVGALAGANVFDCISEGCITSIKHNIPVIVTHNGTKYTCNMLNVITKIYNQKTPKF